MTRSGDRAARLLTRPPSTVARAARLSCPSAVSASCPISACGLCGSPSSGRSVAMLVSDVSPVASNVSPASWKMDLPPLAGVVGGPPPPPHVPLHPPAPGKHLTERMREREREMNRRVGGTGSAAAAAAAAAASSALRDLYASPSASTQRILDLSRYNVRPYDISGQFLQHPTTAVSKILGTMAAHGFVL